MRDIRLTVAVLFVVAAAKAQDGAGWRFWDTASGMQESYVQSIGVDPKGRVWVVPGAVGTMNVLDGYELRRLPHPGFGAKRSPQWRRMWCTEVPHRQWFSIWLAVLS